MKFILIIAVIVNSGYGISDRPTGMRADQELTQILDNSGKRVQSISMQEFNSKKSCEEAGTSAYKLATNIQGGDPDQVSWQCVSK